MATVNLTRGEVFPIGATVTAYPLSSQGVVRYLSGVPQGDPAATGVVSSAGRIQFIGLEPETLYVAHSQVNGNNRYVYFQTGDEQATSYVRTVGTTPTQLAKGPGSFVARNETDTDVVFLGDAGVSTSSYEWDKGGLEYSFDLARGEELYARSATLTQTIHVLRTSR